MRQCEHTHSLAAAHESADWYDGTVDNYHMPNELYSRLAAILIDTLGIKAGRSEQSFKDVISKVRSQLPHRANSQHAFVVHLISDCNGLEPCC